MNIKHTLFNRYYHSEEPQLRESFKQYRDYKNDNALYKDVPKESPLRRPGELPVYGMEAGKALGIEPFSPYPGYEDALKIIGDARKYDSYMYDIKAGTEEEVKNFWKILTGQYYPSFAGTGITTSVFLKNKASQND